MTTKKKEVNHFPDTTKKVWFIKRFGEKPEDVLGNDWENYIDEYLEEVEKEEFMIDRL